MRATVILMALLVVATSATAGSVAFLDAERAVAEVGEGRLKVAEIEAWAAPRRQELTALATRLTALQERLAKQAAVGSDDSVNQLRGDEAQLRRSFDDARRAFERELTAKQEALLADVAVKVGTVASAYGRERGFDAIFVRNAQPLVYVADAADVTDTVIRLYNERFPVKATSP